MIRDLLNLYRDSRDPRAPYAVRDRARTGVRVLKVIGLVVIIMGLSHAGARASALPAFHATITPHACTFTVQVTNTTHDAATIDVVLHAGAQSGETTYQVPEGVHSRSFPLATIKGTVVVNGPNGQLAKRKVPAAAASC